MAFFAPQSHIRPAPAAATFNVFGLAHRFTSALAIEWRSFRAARALEALDDRALTDIGVSRPMIEHLVRYGRPSRG